jgi:hypothetical protein
MTHETEHELEPDIRIRIGRDGRAEISANGGDWRHVKVALTTGDGPAKLYVTELNPEGVGGPVSAVLEYEFTGCFVVGQTHVRLQKACLPEVSTG